MKKKNELFRVQEMIKNDRLNTKKEFDELFSIDLNNLLKNYFDYKESANFEVLKNGDKITLNITLNANGIRSFSSLPKD